MGGDLVVLVEDNKSDLFLVREALRFHKLSVELLILEDGEKAIDWIEANDGATEPVRPSVLLLDLNLPKRHGAEVLSRLRSSNKLSDLPVVLFTSSGSLQDRALVEGDRATHFFRKSVDIDEFLDLGRLLQTIISESPSRKTSR